MWLQLPRRVIPVANSSRSTEKNSSVLQQPISKPMIKIKLKKSGSGYSPVQQV